MQRTEPCPEQNNYAYNIIIINRIVGLLAYQMICILKLLIPYLRRIDLVEIRCIKNRLKVSFIDNFVRGFYPNHS